MVYEHHGHPANHALSRTEQPDQLGMHYSRHTPTYTRSGII